MSQQESNKFLLVLGMSSLIPGLIYLEEKINKNKDDKTKRTRGFYFRIMAISFAVCYYLIFSCENTKLEGQNISSLTKGNNNFIDKLIGNGLKNNFKPVFTGLPPF